MKIVVLGGGLTVERDVSLSSSAGICAALREQGHQAVMVYLFLGVEEWIEDINAYFAAEHPFTASVREQAPTLAEIRAMRRDLSASHIGPQVIRLCQAADIVFLGLHGADGEDGKIQAAFDLLGIKYTGSDTRSSVLAMDKSLAKLIFQANGIRVPEGILLEKGGYPLSLCRQTLQRRLQRRHIIGRTAGSAARCAGCGICLRRPRADRTLYSRS